MAEHGLSRPWTPFSKNSSRSHTNEVDSSAASIRSSSSRLRKRSSNFFGRSHSDTNKAQQGGLSRSGSSAQVYQQPSRSKTEPFDLLRSTIFGSRRREPPALQSHFANSNESLTRQDSVAISPPIESRDTFKTEGEYYRHLRKQSISPPFNFEHVTHTAKQQLPALETVQEQDLPREFWSVSARQRPRRHLNGIQATDLPAGRQRTTSETSRPTTAKSRPVSPLTPSETGDDPPHIVTPIEPIEKLDETIFDNISAQTTYNDASVQVRMPSHGHRHPRRESSLVGLPTESRIVHNTRKELGTFYESDDSSSAEADATSTSRPSGSQSQIATEPRELSGLSGLPPDDIAFRSKQPLPPVPGTKAARASALKPSRLDDLARVPSFQLQIPGEQSWSPRSKRSSRHSSQSSKSIGTSPSQSSSTGLRQSTIVSDTTWEDDVDFIYEQEAESTCDFTWEAGSGQSPALASYRSSMSPAMAVYHAHSPGEPAPSVDKIPLRDDRVAESPQPESRRHDEPRKRLHVGHRGFLAARSSSQDLTAAKQNPSPVQIKSSSSYGSLLSPVLSITGEDEVPNKAPLTHTTHFYAQQVIDPARLSDPESCRNSGSTQHRKSSSYGSHESSARPTLAPSGLREGARWSMASSSSLPSSLPDLMHSRPRSKLILSKSVISAPLESLPQSPPSNNREDDSTVVPRELRESTVRNSFILRRPQSPCDRAVLQAAGRTVQDRGSRTSPPRQASRLPLVGRDGMASSGDLPGWI